MDPLTAQALMQVGGAGAKWLFGQFNKPKKFEDTEYAKRLYDISKRGAYTSKVRSQIMGGVSRTAGAAASQARTGYKGNLIARGMENSIAGARGMGDIDTRYMNTLADTRRDVDIRNEQSKIDATDRYAQLKDASDAQRKQFSQMNNANLIGGVIDAGVGYYGGKMQQKIYNQERQDRLDRQNFQDTMAMTTQNLAIEEAQRRRDDLLQKQREFENTAYALRSKAENEAAEAATGADLNVARANDLNARAQGRGYYSPESRGGRGGAGGSDDDKALQQQIDNVFKAIQDAGGKVVTNPRTQSLEIVGGNSKMMPVLRQQLYELMKRQGAIDTMRNTNYNDSDDLRQYTR